MSKQLQQLLIEWLEDLEIGQGRSPRTVANYDRYLRRFFSDQRIELLPDITMAAVRSWRRRASGHGESQRLSAATLNYHLIALRQFLKYLAKRDTPALAPEKIELAKLAERDIDILYPEEIDALLNAPREDAITAHRDRAILHTLFSTGLRISEAVRLNRDDIRLGSNEIAVRGKGNKVRVVFLSPEAQHMIRQYIERRDDIDPALFIRHRPAPKATDDAANLRLTARSIQRSIKRYAAAAGLTKDITPHTLRHSFATDLLSNGADVREVQQLLGHASITTTQIYTHLTDVHLRDVHARYHHTGGADRR